MDEEGRTLADPSGSSAGDVRRVMLERNPIVHSSVMFRRSAYEAAGGFDPGLRTMSDYDLWLRIAQYGSMHLIAVPLVRYRVHPAQLSRTALPWGPHIKAIRRGRRDLARTLGVPVVRTIGLHIVWVGAQYLRYLRLRRLGYDPAPSTRSAPTP
jgi:hypothetical protein